MASPPSNRSPTVVRLFWTFVLGGSAALIYGAPALAATAGAMLLVVLHRLDRPRRFRALVRRTTRAHARTLALRRRQECFVDAYGNTIEDGWLRERAYFAERTIVPALAARGYADDVDANWEHIQDSIERVATSVALPDESETPQDGLAYERFCAQRLEAAGWRAHTTRASGDQGVDIVAERGDTRLVVQCKRYGKPVGNAAVQEITAASRHWSSDMAAVVSNAGFTPAARKLAVSTGVLLLHHDELATL